MIGFITNLGIAGVLAWFLWHTTKQNTKRETARETRDAKREEKILNIVDTSLKDMDKTVTKDSENTEQVKISIDKLEDTISNHLVHSIDKLTTEVLRLNGKK